MVCMEQYCIYCKTVQKIYYFAVNASFAVSLLIFALKFNFLKLHKVDVKLVQSWCKVGRNQVLKNCKKWLKNIEKHINLLEKTWKKRAKNLEKTWNS